MSTPSSSLLNTPDNFVSGKIFAARHLWKALSSDKWIYDFFHGKIEFSVPPTQTKLLRPLDSSVADHNALHCAMFKFLNRKVVEGCHSSLGLGFFFNVFPTLKKDETARVILNLTELHDHIPHVHFKMDTLKEVIKLIQPDYYFATCTYKDAYFSVM